MSYSKKKIYSLNIITATLLFGCGGSETTITPDIQPATISSSPSLVSSTGVITGFGSIYVDGVRYITDNADININGKSGSDVSLLKVGMQVTIASSDDNSETPEASRVSYESEVEGMVSSIDRDNQTIIVAGTLISYNNLTHFIDITEANLSVAQRIEVNGYLRQDNSYLATMIKLDTDNRNDLIDNDQAEYTRGLIEQLNTTDRTFRLNQLIIDYNTASIEGELSNGALVKVKGVLTNETIIASHIETEMFDGNSDSSSEEFSRYEVEGIVSAFDATNNTITVNGYAFALADTVQYQGGTAAALTAGIFVELELSTSRAVVRIEFESDKYRSDGKVKGNIEQIDLDNQLITLYDQAYKLSINTRFEDDDDQYINLQNLQVNDAVEIVFALIDGVKVIQRIERENSREFNDEWEIKGVVSAFDTSSITVNGVRILLNSSSLYLNQDIVVTMDGFINALVLGTSVEVEGYYDSNNQLVINKLELESPSQGDDSSDDQDNSSDDQDSSSDDDAGQGYVEIEGRVSQLLSATSFTLNGYEIRLDNSASLELDDQSVNSVNFMNAISVNTTVEIEGVWVENTYIRVLEAEIESNGNDD
jgi:predicted RNA-binding protein